MRPAFLVLLPLLAACSESGFYQIKDGEEAAEAAIVVTPDHIDFGIVPEGALEVSSFTILSDGEDDLEVSSILIEGPDVYNFSIMTSDTSFNLAPGQEIEIEVSFGPTGSDGHQAQAVINSNARDHEVAIVTLEGQPSVPDLVFDPDPLDFGNSFVGCDKTAEVQMINAGQETLVIDSLSWSGDPTMGLVSDDLGFPIVLNPGDSAPVSFWFLPDDQLNYMGELVAFTNEPEGQSVHLQMGDGVYAGHYTDPWEIPEDPPADIMFAVDQSCSMDDDATHLGNNFASFITQLSSYSTDWQIMVVNDDDGCTNSGILTASTSGYDSTFRTAVRSGGGSYTEALLTVGANAIEQAASGSCNTGFLRSDAMLHLVLVSDEPEQSWSSWSDYVSRIQAAKVLAGGSASNVRISAIAGDVPYGCGGNEPGTGYAEAVAATGGVFLSICSDWASPTNLALLAETSVTQDSFSLTRLPVPETIEVTHNGVLRDPSSWTYDASSNSVTLLSDLPGEGDALEVSYYGAASCD